jgi:hypothetical protein
MNASVPALKAMWPPKFQKLWHPIRWTSYPYNKLNSKSGTAHAAAAQRRPDALRDHIGVIRGAKLVRKIVKSEGLNRFFRPRLRRSS